MSNIARAFDHGKAFVAFITCGDPDLATTEKHPNIMPSGSENGISSASARNFLSNYPERLRRLYHLTKKYY